MKNDSCTIFCENCGNEIEGFYNWTEYAYKLGYNRYFCSWHCIQDYRRKNKHRLKGKYKE